MDPPKKRPNTIPSWLWLALWYILGIVLYRYLTKH